MYLKELAKKAYIYGFPLVESVRTMIGMTTNDLGETSAPVNMFGHATKLLGPEFTAIVSPNNDNLYSFGWCDVAKEPIVLHVPDTNDKYYVMQFIDMWTNNFAYIGRRATGTEEGTYIIVGSEWEGDFPRDKFSGVIKAPTKNFFIAGRTAVEGTKDVPNVIELQKQYMLIPFSKLGDSNFNQEGRKLGDWPLPIPNQEVSDDLKFWEAMRTWMQAYPPHSSEFEMIKSFDPLGLNDKSSPYNSLDKKTKKALIKGEKEAREEIEIATHNIVEKVNGWIGDPHIFDHNKHFLEIGTLKDDPWINKNFLRRAVAARAGLFGNHGYEAYYPTIFEDANGDQLTGNHKYIVHFKEQPPVDAFWSLTMYGVPEFLFIKNPINRYSIGDRTPGLRFEDDGSLIIYIQHENPGPEKESNWLPSPKGDFRPILRMYQPKPEALDGRYVIPPIKRL